MNLCISVVAGAENSWYPILNATFRFLLKVCYKFYFCKYLSRCSGLIISSLHFLKHPPKNTEQLLPKLWSISREIAKCYAGNCSVFFRRLWTIGFGRLKKGIYNTKNPYERSKGPSDVRRSAKTRLEYIFLFCPQLCRAKYNWGMKAHGRRYLRARTEISAGQDRDICGQMRRYPPAKPYNGPGR